MKFLTALLDALAGFVQRNPLTVLLLLLLAIGAPALFRGIAIFILYSIVGFLLLGLGLLFWFRWRLRRVQREMEERFGGGDFGAAGSGPSFSDRRASASGREGDVTIRKTAAAPEKRVSSDVGDYVEFEETEE